MVKKEEASAPDCLAIEYFPSQGEAVCLERRRERERKMIQRKIVAIFEFYIVSTNEPPFDFRLQRHEINSND